MTLRESVIQQVLRDSSALKEIPPNAIRQRSVGTDRLSTFPQAPRDGDEFFLTTLGGVGGISLMRWTDSGHKWEQVGVPPVVTSLPSTLPAGADGIEVYYVADSANSRVWHLRYRAAGSTTYPWEFVGGSPLAAVNAGTSMTTSSTTYVDPSTVGPTLSVPLAGDYTVRWGGEMSHAADTGVGYMAIKNGSTSTADAHAVRGQSCAAGGLFTVSGSQDITVAAAATTLKAQFRTLGGGVLTINGGGTASPWMHVTPVRVGA